MPTDVMQACCLASTNHPTLGVAGVRIKIYLHFYVIQERRLSPLCTVTIERSKADRLLIEGSAFAK